MIAGETEFVRQTGIDSSGDGVEAGVGGVNGYIMFDSRLHDTCLRRLAAELFEPVKEKGMMGEDKLASVHNSFIDHLRRNVCGQENGGYLTSCVTYLHSRVIPVLLGTPWRYRFYSIDDLP